MPRGKSNASVARDTVAMPTVTRSSRQRRALGDVSNRDSSSKGEEKAVKHDSQPVRRSRRLAMDSTGAEEPERAVRIKADPANYVQSKAKSAPAKRPSRKRSEAADKTSTTGRSGAKRARTTQNNRSDRTSRVKSEPRSNLNDDAEKEATRPRLSWLDDTLFDPGHCITLDKENSRLQRPRRNAEDYTHGTAAHDICNLGDVQQVSTYVTDIFQHLYSAEEKTRPHLYMDKVKQPHLNSMMRAILIDWIVEVHMKFRLVPETLYRCVNIIDRYLSRVVVERNRLQLVGVTALLLACKYEEIFPPEVKDCVYITDRAYTRQDVLDMEAEILKKLNFHLTVPTGHPFIQRFLSILDVTDTVRHLSNYYMERMLQEHKALEFKPSLLAATAVALAMNNPDRLMLDGFDTADPPEISAALLDYTGFTFREISEAAELFETKVGQVGTTHGRRELVAVRRKFDSRRYDNVSTRFVLPRAFHLRGPSQT